MRSRNYDGFPGWRQILAGREELLSEYDRARVHSRGHRVQTGHGDAAEASFRAWLNAFLPTRYAAVSGYIVSQRAETKVFPHYDVIVYDQFESPVLWLEGPQGTEKRRAVPVEHVYAVLEVKAALTPGSAREALAKLLELRPFLNKCDGPGERYPRSLPTSFCMGCVFFELRQADGLRCGELGLLVPDDEVRGYFGGLILRGEGLDPLASGELRLARGQEPIAQLPPDPSATIGSGFVMSGSKAWANDAHMSMLAGFGAPNFAKFGFDLLALMRGTYDPRFLSSFHGLAWEKPDNE